ncbi:uncharacterized protein DMENIID0001_003400 [Sergentomyia squamirostris]
MSKRKRETAPAEDSLSYDESLKVKINNLDKNNPRNYFGPLTKKDDERGQIVSDRKYCILCWEQKANFSYSASTSASNYENHLRIRHNKTFEPAATSADLNKNQSKIDSIFKPDQQTVGKKPLNQKYIIARRFATFAARQLIPFTVFDSTAFHDLLLEMKWIQSTDVLPHSTTVSGKALQDVYGFCKREVKAHLLKCLAHVLAMAITADGWTDDFSHRKFLTITAHVISESMELIHYSLKTFGMDGAETDSDERENNLISMQIDEVSAKSTESLPRVKSASETRWSSIYEMTKSFMDHEDTYRKIMEEAENHDLLLTSREKMILSDIIEILKVLRDATILLEGQEYSTANLGLLIFLRIKMELEKQATTGHGVRRKKWARMLLENLVKRYVISEDILVASILDPTIYKLTRVKDYLKENNIDPEDLIRQHDAAYKEQEGASSSSQASSSLACRPSTSTSTSTTTSARLSLIESFRQEGDDAVENDVLKEWRDYTECTGHIIIDNPLEWWKERKEKWPRLSRLVREKWAIPLTSSPSERNFSSAGALITAKRSRLGASKAEAVLFIHDNYKIFKSVQ